MRDLFIFLLLLCSVLLLHSQVIPDSIQKKSEAAKTFHDKGKVFFDYYSTLQGTSTEKLEFLYTQLAEFNEQTNPARVAYTELYIASIAGYIGDLSVVLKHSLGPVDALERVRDTFGLFLAYNGIGFAYGYTKNEKQSFEYWRKALVIARKRSVRWTSTVLNNMADCFLQLNRPDSALLYIREAVHIDSTLQDTASLATTLCTLGQTYTLLQKHDTARKCLHRARLFSDKARHSMEIAYVFYSLSESFFQTGELDSSLSYSYKSLTYAENDYLSLAIKCFDLMQKIYGSRNMSDSAYKYLLKTATLKDSLFSLQKTQSIQTLHFQQQMREQEIKSAQIDFRNKIKTYGLLVVVAIFFLLAVVFYRSTRLKQKAKSVIEKSYADLRATQAQLIQSEKMASLGELTAGIAHEIQNPLNFVNNFSEVNTELIEEMQKEIDRNNLPEVKSLANDLKENEAKIIHHGKRADSIVKNMLQHARRSKGVKEPTDINKLADEYVRLAYHGKRAKDKSFHTTINTDFDPSVGDVSVMPQEIGRVILNLVNNAFDAVDEKRKREANGYEPRVEISTKRQADKISIRVQDNGTGIPEHLADKIFQPFFTTKPTGQGTGLGLSLSYDIVKVHGGELKVDSNGDSGATFIVQLPIQDSHKNS